MMNNARVFENENLLSFKNSTLKLLNSCSAFDDERVINSPRAVGDIVQEVIGEHLDELFDDGLVKECNASFARRAMADMAFSDNDNNYFVIVSKTHNTGTNFSMPNLISVERLARFYEEDSNYFVILLVEYHTDVNGICFDQVNFAPIENFSWDCLTIGALGWGQLQIANANFIKIDRKITRKEWMLSLCDRLDEFYPKEIGKIEKRISRFKKVREFWENK